jgi:hypothetical protein
MGANMDTKTRIEKHIGARVSFRTGDDGRGWYRWTTCGGWRWVGFNAAAILAS